MLPDILLNSPNIETATNTLCCISSCLGENVFIKIWYKNCCFKSTLRTATDRVWIFLASQARETQAHF